MTCRGSPPKTRSGSRLLFGEDFASKKSRLDQSKLELPSTDTRFCQERPIITEVGVVGFRTTWRLVLSHSRIYSLTIHVPISDSCTSVVSLNQPEWLCGGA